MIRRLASRFKRCEHAGPAVETALAAPLITSLFITVIETANAFMLASTLENAVLHASRFGVTGAENDLPRADRVRQVIEEQTFGRVPAGDIQIETLVYQQFADIGQGEPYTDENDNDVYDEGEEFSDINGNGVWDADMAIAGLGGSGDIVLYRVSFAPRSLTGLLDWATENFTLSATVAVRNEPF